MVDTCTVERVRLDENKEPVREMDPVTLEVSEVWDVVHSGRCRSQRFRGQGLSDVVVGGVEFGKSSLMMQLPISALGVARGDRVTVTAVGAVSDPALVGVVATVVADVSKTHATKRTLMCEVVS